jgi:hypothetical protein
MNRIVDIVPAPPSWHARWRFTAGRTMSYPAPDEGRPEDVFNPIHPATESRT